MLEERLRRLEQLVADLGAKVIQYETYFNRLATREVIDAEARSQITAMKSAYNNHTHVDSGSGTTSGPSQTM